MKFIYDDYEYDIVINKKRTTKNTYIRVNSDLEIVVSCNTFTPNIFIKNLIKNNTNNIIKMIETQKNKKKNNDGFFYLGNRYEIIYKDIKDIEFDGDKVYFREDFDIDKWYKKQAKKLFLERLDFNYDKYTRKIPYPKLRIRKMTTRWGVCNIKTHVITLNLELIKRDAKYLDYVIVHELTHFIYGNHSKYFWNLVEENYPGYKKFKNDMKEFL